MTNLVLPHAFVERHGDGFVVVLLKPDGERNYYVATGVDSDKRVYPYVCFVPEKAKIFGLEDTAKTVAGDMTAFLRKEYRNLVTWHRM